MTQNFIDSRVISCGILDTPRYGFKSNNSFVNGTTVNFSCHEGFIVRGDAQRTCTDEGKWSKEVHGYTSCIRKYHTLYRRYKKIKSLTFPGNEEQIARTTGTSVAIFLFIIVPLSLIIIIFLKQHFKTLRQAQEEVEEEKRWNEIEMMRLQQQRLLEGTKKEPGEEHSRFKEDEIDDGDGERLIETPL